MTRQLVACAVLIMMTTGCGVWSAICRAVVPRLQPPRWHCRRACNPNLRCKEHCHRDQRCPRTWRGAADPAASGRNARRANHRKRAAGRCVAAIGGRGEYVLGHESDEWRAVVHPSHFAEEYLRQNASACARAGRHRLGRPFSRSAESSATTRRCRVRHRRFRSGWTAARAQAKRISTDSFSKMD